MEGRGRFLGPGFPASPTSHKESAISTTPDITSITAAIEEYAAARYEAGGADAAAQIASLESQAIALQAALDAAQADDATDDATIADLQSQLSLVLIERDQAIADRDAALADDAVDEAQIADLQAQLAAAQADDAADDAAVAALEADLAALRAEFDAYKAANPEEPEGPEEPAKDTSVDAGDNLIRINGQERALAGVNVARGTDQIVAYTTGTVPTNQYGTEVVVVNGVVQSVVDRNVSGAAAPAIPANGYVLSGHENGATYPNTAAKWLRDNAVVGATVEIVKTTVTPPVDPPADSALNVALYFMMWSNSGSPLLRNIPTEITEVRLAFMQEDPLKLVGWASQTEADFMNDVKTLQARGVRVGPSIGGANGHVNTANRQAFVDRVVALHNQFKSHGSRGIDLLDWDIESGSSFPAADVVWISRKLVETIPGIRITMAPNGSNIDAYRSCAVTLNQPFVGSNGVSYPTALHEIGQQFYDAVVSKEAARGRHDQLSGAGIPDSKQAVGCMVGDADVYWTVAECVEAINYIQQTHPGVKKAYLWEAGRANTAAWATQAKAALLN